MLNKDQILSLVQSMPEQFTIDEIVERLFFVANIEQGLQDVKEGRSYSTSQAKEILAQWL